MNSRLLVCDLWVTLLRETTFPPVPSLTTQGHFTVSQQEVDKMPFSAEKSRTTSQNPLGNTFIYSVMWQWSTAVIAGLKLETVIITGFFSRTATVWDKDGNFLLDPDVPQLHTWMNLKCTRVYMNLSRKFHVPKQKWHKSIPPGNYIVQFICRFKHTVSRKCEHKQIYEWG